MIVVDSLDGMVDELRSLKINAVELLRQPGAAHRIVESIPAEPLGVVHDRLTGEIDVALQLDSMKDGIEVSGVLRAPWATSCRRCLKDIAGVAEVDVDELYQIEVTAEDAYPIEHNQLDLAPMLRELALLELDAEQVCADACAGLCPMCGVDLNVEACDCDTTVEDHRWAALDGLVLDDT